MQESDLNRAVFGFFRENGFGYKIPDPRQMVTTKDTQRPFEGFSVLKNQIFFLEGKLIKSDMGSFNFNKIEDHQIKYLSLIRELTRECGNVFNLVHVGWYVPRKVFKVIFLYIDLVNYLKSIGKNSIVQKDWRKIPERFFYNIKIVEKKYTLITENKNISTNYLSVTDWIELFEYEKGVLNGNNKV